MQPVITPQVSWPFRRGGPDGDLVMCEQDSVEDIRSCCNFIARCPLAFRNDRPEFGWRPPLWRNAPVNASALETALRAWEPRIQDINSEVLVDAATQAYATINEIVGVVAEDDEGDTGG